MARSATNVVGNSIAAVVVAKLEGQLGEEGSWEHLSMVNNLPNTTKEIDFEEVTDLENSDEGMREHGKDAHNDQVNQSLLARDDLDLEG